MNPALALLMLMGWKVCRYHTSAMREPTLALVGPRYYQEALTRTYGLNDVVLLWPECIEYDGSSMNNFHIDTLYYDIVDSSMEPAPHEEIKPAWAERILSLVTTGRDNRMSEE